MLPMGSFEPDNGESRGRSRLILPVGLLTLSLFLFVAPPVAQQRISSAIRASVLAPFLWMQASIHRARVLSENIGELRLQLDSALATLHSQATEAEENRRLRKLLLLRDRAPSAFVSASAIRSGTRGSEGTFFLDVGRVHGVGANAPVIAADGLIGVVREVSSETALALDWTHPEFRVSAMTADGTVFGIVESRRGTFRYDDRLLFNGIPFQTEVENGTPVVTSGRGPVYPRGILIGRMAGLAEVGAGWRRSYWIDPAVSPESAMHVLVLTGEPFELGVDGAGPPLPPGVPSEPSSGQSP